MRQAVISIYSISKSSTDKDIGPKQNTKIITKDENVKKDGHI
jgi:hypothetical protein